MVVFQSKLKFCRARLFFERREVSRLSLMKNKVWKPLKALWESLCLFQGNQLHVCFPIKSPVDCVTKILSRRDESRGNTSDPQKTAQHPGTTQLVMKEGAILLIPLMENLLLKLWAEDFLSVLVFFTVWVLFCSSRSQINSAARPNSLWGTLFFVDEQTVHGVDTEVVPATNEKPRYSNSQQNTHIFLVIHCNISFNTTQAPTGASWSAS